MQLLKTPETVPLIKPTSMAVAGLNCDPMAVFVEIVAFWVEEKDNAGINNCTIAGALVFNSGGGTPATNRLLCYLTGTNLPVTANGGDLTIQFNSLGVFLVSGSS